VDYLPVFMDIRGQTCLLAGGGEVALRKANLLLRAGAVLRVVAPEIRPELQALLAEHGGEIRQRCFEPQDLDGVVLAIAGTSDDAANRQISELARARQLPVNVVDQKPLCSFIVPAIVDRSPVVVAISTGGSSPVLTRQLKEKIETILPSAYGRLAALLGSWRGKVKSAISDFGQRTRFWEEVLDGPVPGLVFAGREQEAEAALDRQLSQPERTRIGEVYLVGAGPGDPDLLTLKALRLMYAADVVLYDRLVSAEILARVRPDAEKIAVGKQRAHHPVPQEEINALLIRHARAGQKVLRLKGGDPFIFGRGGEEIDQLASLGIPFQVVPGITAASGCAAYAGIPLTHRDHAQSVRFVTGHLKEGNVQLEWRELAREQQQTLVVYMGLISLPEICEQLQAHGMAATMPVALVAQGTTAKQQVVIGTLESIVARVEAAGLQAPAIVIIGEVVRLQPELAWFAGE